MSEATKANAIIIQRGTYHLGINTRDKDGNTVTKSEPRWEPDPNGSAVVICGFNTETDETIGAGDLFSWWDSSGVYERVWEKLNLCAVLPPHGRATRHERAEAIEVARRRAGA